MAIKEMNKRRLITYISIGLCALIILLGLLLYSIFGGRVKMNPEGTVGNTAGNLNNSGLVCEYNDTVYFSNPTDNGALYAMNPDETNLRKLYSMPVRNILAGGEYLYYYQLKGTSDSAGISSVTSTHSLNRCNLDGEKSVEITRDVVVVGQLVDNYLYLLTAGRENPDFYKIKIDKTNQVHLASYVINPACARNGIIYYNGTLEDHALYRLNTSNDAATPLWSGSVWYPIVEGDYVYFMDISSNYRLCRYSFSQDVVEVLTNERVDCFNVGNGYIYYQTNDAVSPQLKCMHTDGSNVLVVADGIYTNINMSSQYVYFQEFNVPGSFFHARLGSNQYRFFGL